MNLWTWGANSHGQLGLEFSSEQVEKPTVVPLPQFTTSVKQIACGGGHTLLLDDDGKLFSCGWNLNQQLGIGDKSIKEVEKFQRVWCMSGITFTNIATGWDFSCAVTDDNFLLVWGSNNNGQLGLPKLQFAEIEKPIRLQVNARAVAMGLRHTAIINSKEEVWITGNGKQGQLGLGDDVIQSEKFQKVLNIGKISHIACGQNHTVAWSSDEKVLYGWGDNKHGQLLQRCTTKEDNVKNIFVPQKIDVNITQRVKKLLSGWTNILLLLEDGTILTWGRNNYSQLGTEELTSGKIFHVQLPGHLKIKDIALGSEHTICLADDNTLWAWGWNEHANTGISMEPVIPIPTLVPLEEQDYKIMQIYAGGAHNFVVTKKCKE